MASGVDIQREKEKTLRLACQALAEALKDLAEIEARQIRGEEIDQTIIERIKTSISDLEALVK